MRLLLVNQFVPPDEAPTARLLGELALGLKAHGWTAGFLGGGGTYRGQSLRGWRRWWRDLRAHARILTRGLAAPRPDVIICLSDPPALVFTMAVVAKLRSVTLVHWPMDVYPRIAAALGEVRGHSLLYRIVGRAVGWGMDRCAAVVPLDEDMRNAVSRGRPEDAPAIAPWPPRDIVVPAETGAPAGDVIRWLYSGNLGRAHDYETLLRAQRLLEDRGAPFELVFQGGGPARDPARRMAADLQLNRCVWRDYANASDLASSLLDAHILVATQRPETRGLLWPSKLALLRSLPRPIVWVGPTDGAVAISLRQTAACAGIFAPGNAAGLAGWLIDRAAEARRMRLEACDTARLRGDLDAARETAIGAWRGLLAGLAPSSAAGSSA